MKFRARPTYLDPVSMPLRSTIAAQVLRSLQQGTGVAHRTLQDVEKNLERFEKFPDADKKAAAEALELDADALTKAARKLIDASPQESKPQKAASPSDLRKQK